MEIQHSEECPVNFIFTERTKLRMQIRSIDNLLRDLPPRLEWDAKFPEGPSLEVKRSDLEAQRQALWEKLQEKPLRPANDKGENFLSIARSQLPQGTMGVPIAKKQSKAGLLRSIFVDSGCSPKEEEMIVITPNPPMKNFSINRNTIQWTNSHDNNSLVDFYLTVFDPNNDPFNWGDAFGWMSIYWEYELPPRVFRAQYDVSIIAGIRAQVTSVSNHVLGTHWWCGWLTGGLSAEGEVVFIDDPNQPIYKFRDWDNDPLDYIDTVGINRSIILEPNQSLRLYLYYRVDLGADRGIAEATGTVQAMEANAQAPGMYCTITEA